jgi:hypothetical protein
VARLLRLWELDLIVLDRACARTFIRTWQAHAA